MAWHIFHSFKTEIDSTPGEYDCQRRATMQCKCGDTKTVVLEDHAWGKWRNLGRYTDGNFEAGYIESRTCKHCGGIETRRHRA